MARPPTTLIKRHSLVVRITHWTNVLSLWLLLMSGLQIFNAHPALYWGKKATFAQPWVSMTSEERGDRMIGLTKVGPLILETTGLFGFSGGEKRGFPAWATAPNYRSLADGTEVGLRRALSGFSDGFLTELSRGLAYNPEMRPQDIEEYAALLAGHLRSY